jgi:hypothetical protein
MDLVYSKFAPIARSGHPKLKEGSSSYNSYWEEQEYYIKNGYSVDGEDITGSLYFFLNYYKIDFVNDTTKERGRIFPYLSDVDKEWFYTLEQCRKYDKDFITVKVRDKGFSNLTASEVLRLSQFYSKSKCGCVFPGGQSKALQNWKEKYFSAINDLPQDLRVNPDIDNDGQLTFAFKVKDRETKIETMLGLQSRVSFFNAVNKDVLKSDRYSLGLIDELGEIDIAKELINTSVANFKQGSAKIGTLVVGGTTNNLNKGYTAFRSLWYDAEERGFERMFIPAWRKYFPKCVDTETGESLKEEAMEILDIAEKKAASLGKADLTEHWQNFGNTIEQVFSNAEYDFFDKEKLSGQIAKLLGTPHYKGLIQKGNLRRVTMAGGEQSTIFELDNLNGRWLIYQHPLHIVLPDCKKKDYVGVDSVYKDIAEESNSKCAIVVRRPFINVNTIGECPVCIYLHRYNEEGGKEKFYEDLELTLDYYKTAALVERTDEELFNYFRKRALLHKLHQRPSSVFKHAGKSTRWEDYGVPPNGQEAIMASRLLKTDVNKNYGNIMFVPMLDSLMEYGVKNSDLGDAYKWALLLEDAQVRVLPEVAERLNKNKTEIPRLRKTGEYSATLSKY